MAVEIRVPALGESIVEATIARWIKPEGAPVEEGEPLVELETDKVNVEVPASASGVLERITKKEGETVGINDVLGLLADGATASASTPTAPAATQTPAAPLEAMQLSADAVPQVSEARGNGRGKVAASPMAQQIAVANGLDLSLVAGSGPGGKVLKEDVEAFIERGIQTRTSEARPATPVQEPAPTPVTPQPETVRAPEPPRAPAPTPALVSAATAGGDRREERIPMSRRRQTIATNVKHAQETAATLTTFNEIDMSAVMEVRKRRKDSFFERHNVRLGFMSFFTKAVVGALKAFPYLNAEIQGTDIVLKRYYDIGIAVSTEEGLVVPVVRDADRKSFAEIEKEIGDLAARARDRKLTLADLQGGTFSITNGGVFGSLLATPILNYPQVGILGMHKIEERPVAVNGQVVIKPMMYVALSYDHRIVDGRESVGFLVRVKELIEDPETLLLEG